MDDIFCLFHDEIVASLFLEYLNKQHSNIKFTSESEKSGNLPFLDVNIDKKEGGGYYTSLFHKSSCTGLLTNFLSYTPQTYKLALIKSLIHRIYKICNTWVLFHKNILELKEVLKRNMFPIKIIDAEIRKYLNNKFNEKMADEDSKPNKNYYKLPYLGIISKLTQKKLRKLGKELYKGIDITLCFSVCKIGSFFITKK